MMANPPKINEQSTGNSYELQLMTMMKGVCKKTIGPTGSTGGQWVGQWWVGPKGWIAGISLSRPLQTTGQHSGMQLFNS